MSASPRWFGASGLLGGLKRIVAFCGAYGSGKTEVAVNFASHLAADGGEVSIADLDIVNPYFRSREAREALQSCGVDVLVPSGELVNADLPIVQPEIRGALEQGGGTVVLDLGGDPVGARVAASLADVMLPGSYDCFFVVNTRRPFTSSAESAGRMMAEISAMSGLAVTGLVVNSHLIDETDAGTISEGIAVTRELESRSGLPIAFVAIERGSLAFFDPAAHGLPVMVMDRYMLKPWERGAKVGCQKFKL